MDELRAIREVLPTVVPPAESTLHARDRLMSEMRATQPQSRRGHRRWLLVGAAALATIVAAVSAIFLNGSPKDDPVALTPAELSARAILLAAARQTVEQGTGEYWHIQLVEQAGPLRVGAAPDPYYLLRHTVTETWIGRDPQETSWYGYRMLGYRARGEADEQAWRAAGSPKQWTIPTGKGSERLTDAPGEPKLQPIGPTTTYLSDLGGFSFPQIQELPVVPAQLQALFAARIADEHPAPDRWGANVRLFDSMTTLLLNIPAPAKVRAAALAVLAGIPEMYSAGSVVDLQGRNGVGIELSRTANGYSEYHRLVIDATTHLILEEDYVAQQGARPPTKEDHLVVLQSEWTNEQPVPPPIP